MNNEQAIQKVVNAAEVDADEAERVLRRTVKTLSEWEPPEVTAKQLADKVVSAYPVNLVDDQFRETCLRAAEVTLEATSA